MDVKKLTKRIRIPAAVVEVLQKSYSYGAIYVLLYVGTSEY